MPDAGAAAELRALQSKAYGRGGGLSEAEAARLHELEGARDVAGPPAAPPTDVDETASSASHRVSSRSLALARSTTEEDDKVVDRAEGESKRSDETPIDHAEPSPRGSLRRFWRQLSIGAALLLALGLGIGWLVFGRSMPDAIPLTEEQQSWQADIAGEGSFDPGSLQAMAVEGDVVVWAATQAEGKSLCLVMGAEGESIQSCNSAEMARKQGLYGSFTKGEGQGLSVSAQMLFSASGEPAVAVSSYQTSGDSGIVYASEEETAVATALAEQGYIAESIWVVGYDGATPIWTAQRQETGESCLIYGGSDADAPTDCRDLNSAEGAQLEVNMVDATTGALTTLSFGPGNGGPPYLQVTRSGE